MIEISPTTALMLYLCLTLGTLLGIWAFHHYSSRRNKVILAEQQLAICEYCSFCYLSDIGKDVSKCPQCGSFNSKNVTM